MDEDAEAVKQKHVEEVREENETQEMALQDKTQPKVEVEEEPCSPSIAQTEINMQEIFSDCYDVGDQGDKPVPAASQSGALQLPMEVPQTPVDVGDGAPVTPRTSPSTRMRAD